MRLPLRPLIATLIASSPILFGAPPAGHRDIDPAYADRVVDAIYRAEGGPKAKVPFGILSVKVASFAEARRVCLRTVVNNHRRWHNAGRPGHFIDFLGDRYCPSATDPVGNRRWKNNVKAILLGAKRVAAKLPLWDYG